jgi:hypothetical protein
MKLFNLFQLKIIVVFAFLLSTFSSCKKDEFEKPFDPGKNYYPFVQGNYIEYEVDSIAFVQLPTVDTVIKKLRIKVVMDSLYSDAEGRPSMRIVRYRKDISNGTSPDSLVWVIQDVWTSSKTASFAEQTEENVPFVKLVFPVAKSKEWNGNSRNTLGPQNYTYQNVDVPENSNGIPFDSVLTVNQKFSSSAIAYSSEIEKYARGVGMIFKESVNVFSQNVNGLSVLDRIESGIVYRMKIISYAVQEE